MMGMHPTPAERLLAMLEEDGIVESLPASEVYEGLAALGVDPARSIAFAKSLARGGATPGGKLMGALLAGEAQDEEIARIEAADIEEVRAAVDQGTAAAIAAEARRKAGADDKVVGLGARRRKRGRLIVWGGPLAGIAASLLVVVIGLQMLDSEFKTAFDSGRPSTSREADYAPRDIQAGKPDEEAGLAKEKSATEETFALGEQQASGPAVGDRKDAPAEPEARLRKQEELAAAAPVGEAEDKNIAPAKPSAAKKKQDRSNEAPPPAALLAPSPKPAPEDGRAAETPSMLMDSLGGVAGGGKIQTESDDSRKAEPAPSTGSTSLPEIAGAPEGNAAGEIIEAENETADLRSSGTDTDSGLARDVVISEIAAVLVVDPSQASMQVQSQILPSGELVDRVDEAQRLAGDRPVIALYTIATGDAHRDFAQVPLQTGLGQQLAAPSPLVGLLGVEATEYDFIALPAE
jgi:hypothetical protein